METIVDRIKLLIDEYFGNQKKFAEILEIHPGTVNRWFNKEGISLEMINKIVNAVPDLNTEWLIRGEGEIFKKEDKDGKIIREPASKYIKKDATVEKMEAHIKSLEGQIAYLQDLLRREVESRLKEQQ